MPQPQCPTQAFDTSQAFPQECPYLLLQDGNASPSPLNSLGLFFLAPTLGLAPTAHSIHLGACNADGS